jgi:outer membrane receptor protein involved in Fe transport
MRFKVIYWTIAAALGWCAAVAAAETVFLGEITVTGTREETPRAETPATVKNVKAMLIEEIKPGHPSEIMGRIPGVHINVTGGEGHAAAIRQPITTSPVYLYLEDGIPIRSTGFFNHNALYEVNMPQSGGIEVLKGPGTALYGSDAIGGVVNVLTRPAPTATEATASVEGGGHGWQRLLLSGGQGWESDGIRLDLNLTHTDGWREATEYDRQSGSLRWDRFLDDGASLKTVLAVSNIDQQSAGSSRLFRDDYLNNPTRNYTPISFREVQAVRLSTAYEKEIGPSLFSITPYYRNNDMTLLPNWTLSYDATVYDTWNQSFGALLKYRHDFAPGRTRLIVGTDLDYSPGGRFERSINTVKNGNVYTSYTINQTVYDYNATFMAAAPYLHLETSPSERLRLNGGLRLDLASFDYENNLSVLQTGSRRRPASTTVAYSHLSPKLGATYAFTEDFNGFVSYRHAFRVPSESQLFRQGRAENTVDLEPVKADSYELGVRGQTAKWLRYELSGYYMPVRDDILTFIDTATGDRETTNAGKTLHRGVELGLGLTPIKEFTLDLAFSYAKHTYEEWSPSTGVDYADKEIISAPRLITSTRLAWRPDWLRGGRLEVEWERLGSYWMDDENTTKYDGHDLFNLRGDVPLGRGFALYGRLMNLADERFATAASFTTAKGEEFAPGLPRTLYLGLTYAFH